MAFACSCAPLDAPPSTQDSNLTPANFPAIVYPSDNPFSSAKASLGRRLFYDRRLSLDYSTSCADCHKQEFAFSDGGAILSKGFHGSLGVRNAMSLTNVAYNVRSGWDGGLPSLEAQILVPLLTSFELNMNADTIIERLETDPFYQRAFSDAWGDQTVTLDRMTKSIATFERTFISSNSAYDKFVRGDANALTQQQQHGQVLFFGEKADCFHCHGSYNFTDFSFHNNGLDSVATDIGREAVTGLASDRGVFRAPTLRNIGLTAPYMHDGRFATLQEVLKHYNEGGHHPLNQDPLIRPLGLTNQDQTDLIAFLQSLTDSAFVSDTTLSNPWK